MSVTQVTFLRKMELGLESVPHPISKQTPIQAVVPMVPSRGAGIKKYGLAPPVFFTLKGVFTLNRKIRRPSNPCPWPKKGVIEI